MDDILQRIGMFSIFLLIIYLMKKADDYSYSKNEENNSSGLGRKDEY